MSPTLVLVVLTAATFPLLLWAIGRAVTAIGERAPNSRVRFLVATGLGLVAIAGSVVLVAADGVGGGIRWAHHSGVSAAPLLLGAGAIAAVSVARPARGRRALMRFVAVLAFTAWGVAQLFPDSGAADVLNDLAILLFVVDAGCAVISDAGMQHLPHVPGGDPGVAGEPGHTDQPRAALSQELLAVTGPAADSSDADGQPRLS